MKIVRRILGVLLCLSFVVACFAGFACISRQNASGAHSSVTTITEANRSWIIDHFGDCSDIECLMCCVEDYAIQNFCYDYNKPLFKQYIQYPDFTELINSKKGNCFDFACFFKNCCLVWAEHNGADLKVYVVDIKNEGNKFGFGHSYNVVQMPNEKKYYCDITNSIYKVQVKGAPPAGLEIFYESIEDYASRYNEKVVMLH